MGVLDLSVWDMAILSAEDQQTIRTLKQAYQLAKSKGDENNAQKINELAEQVRSKYNYAGGSDGSGHSTLPPTGSTGPIGSTDSLGIGSIGKWIIGGVIVLILLGR